MRDRMSYPWILRCIDWRGRLLRKFMVALDGKVFFDLEQIAKARNISIQLLRAIVIPEGFGSITGAG